MAVHVFACTDRASFPGEYWYEVETDHGDPDGEITTIHTDGMYPTGDAAIEAGEAWAREQGYEVYR